MFAYYLRLALHSLRRNVVLTILMILAIGVGIGASMTTVTVFRAMSGDPIPEKSAQLFAIQFGNWPMNGPQMVPGDGEGLQEQISYREAVNLMNAHAATRQAAMYSTGLALTPANPQLQPFQVQARATYRDLFPMFDVPFRYGGAWSADDDRDHAEVVVISRALNDKLFAGANSVGKTLSLDNHDYRVVGVIEKWEPIPRFYDLTTDKYGTSGDLFLPFTRAIEAQMETWGNSNCSGNVDPGWEGRLNSECVWIQFWAELPTPADVTRYRAFLKNYATEQQRSGRFDWLPRTGMHDVPGWLIHEHAVSNEVRILVLVSFSFLAVCLLNAMGLMLAKIMGRSGDMSVRRALGANRGAVFSQCLIEAGVIGLAGGLLGLGLTILGLLGLRSLFSDEVNRLSHLSPTDVGLAVLLGVAATVVAGLYPTWRAVQVQPAWQLKAQ